MKGQAPEPVPSRAAPSSALRCKQTLAGWRPYWQHGQGNECGKRAHWMWKSSLRGKVPLCTRHAKAVGIETCARINAPNEKAEPHAGLGGPP